MGDAKSADFTALKYAPLSMIVPINCRSRDASVCVEALEDAIAKYGKPEIINTDSHISADCFAIACRATDSF